MNNEIKIIFSSVICVILFGFISSVVIENRTPVEARGEAGSFACTMDAKLCPDGSFVGRVPPYCQFAACSSW